MMTMTNIKASMINDRTTLVLVNQRKNLRDVASTRRENGCGDVVKIAMIFLLIFY
jgi:hypothetical protein